jgi:hypothetical protein
MKDQFHQYQQNEQPPLSLISLNQKEQTHKCMPLSNKILYHIGEKNPVVP